MTIFNGKVKFLITAALLITTAVLSSFLYNAAASPVKTYAADTGSDTKRTLNVTGQGIINATPDIAYVMMGVVTESKVARDAQKANADNMSKIIALIKASGIKDEDVKTVNYSINPKYDYNKDTGVSNIIGYTVTNSVKVTVRDISKTGSIIDIATNSGMNITGNVSFGLSDYDTNYNNALKAAVESAKKKADTIAAALGITLKLPLTINENGGYNPQVNFGVADLAMKSEGAAPTPIQGGSLEIDASVSISYEY